MRRDEGRETVLERQVEAEPCKMKRFEVPEEMEESLQIER